MELFCQLYKAYINKKKLWILFVILSLAILSVHYVFIHSLFSQPTYIKEYPQAGLEFYYYIHSIGINPYWFICMMLLLPNIVSADFLNINISHIHYMIETRVSKKKYFWSTFYFQILMTFVSILLFELLLLTIIHFFYLPIAFHAFDYPPYYYITTQLLSSNEYINLLLFILMTAFGYSVISAFIFTLQHWISNVYVYRSLGIIVGIMLVLLPAFIQIYMPIENLAFILQIQNLVCLGIEGVRDPPLGMSLYMLYFIAVFIYSAITFYLASIYEKGRNKNG